MLCREEFRLNYFPHEEVRPIERGSYRELFTALALSSSRTLFTASLGSDSFGCISYEEERGVGKCQKKRRRKKGDLCDEEKENLSAN